MELLSPSVLHYHFARFSLVQCVCVCVFHREQTQTLTDAVCRFVFVSVCSICYVKD